MLEAIEIIVFVGIVLGVPLVLWLRIERENQKRAREGLPKLYSPRMGGAYR